VTPLARGWGEFGNPFEPMHAWWYLFAVVVAALLVLYVLVQLYRRSRYLRFANTDILDKVAPKRSKFLAHVPVAILLAGLLLLTVALSGPTTLAKVPKNRATVVLVVDISLSMVCDDVRPTRVDAARQAAIKFVDEMEPTLQLGLVTFAGTAQTLIAPSSDHEIVKRALDEAIRPDKLAARTATGEGIYTALQQIETLASILGGKSKAPPARIVLESDGKETVPDDLNAPRGAFTAAKEAKAKEVPIYSISFGTTRPIPYVNIQGSRVPVPADDASLQKVAELSGGKFFTAGSLDQLSDVYSSLNAEIGYDLVKQDSSRPWILAGTLLVIAAVASNFLVGRALP
jgi:Ca-activated chloride channel family protein